MRIGHNMSAISAINSIKKSSEIVSKNAKRLSSGYRIDSAADDAAGLSISEKMRAQIKGLDMAGRNATDAISLIQTAEGALGDMHGILQRVRELSIQAANDTLTEDDRSSIADEMSQLGDEIDRIRRSTDFNTRTLLKGANTPLNFQVGANDDSGLSFTIDKANIPTSSILFGAAYNPFTDVHVDLSLRENAYDVLNGADTCIERLSRERSNMGAMQNRLEHAIAYLGNASENLSASESRIRDEDMAKGMMEYTKGQILQQTGLAILAQVNQNPKQILELLK